jgi:hypothetical protein
MQVQKHNFYHKNIKFDCGKHSSAFQIVVFARPLHQRLQRCFTKADKGSSPKVHFTVTMEDYTAYNRAKGKNDDIGILPAGHFLTSSLRYPKNDFQNICAERSSDVTKLCRPYHRL